MNRFEIVIKGSDVRNPEQLAVAIQNFVAMVNTIMGDVDYFTCKTGPAQNYVSQPVQIGRLNPLVAAAIAGTTPEGITDHFSDLGEPPAELPEGEGPPDGEADEDDGPDVGAGEEDPGTQPPGTEDPGDEGEGGPKDGPGDDSPGGSDNGDPKPGDGEGDDDEGPVPPGNTPGVETPTVVNEPPTMEGEELVAPTVVPNS